MLKHNKSQYVAEFIGTFFLVFFGCGSAIIANMGGSPVLIPFVFGAVVSVMIYAVGHISGAHFNPAVTISFWAIKRFPAFRVPGYIISQTLGALAAAFVLKLIWGHTSTSLGETLLSIPLWSGFAVEFILSFVLMFVITSVATDSRAEGQMAGIAIGFIVMLCAAVGGSSTGASMNPARSIGPAIASGNFTHLWVYIVSCTLGAILGALVYDWIRCQKAETDGHGCC